MKVARSWTILVYTLVLVVLWVFMAMWVLNLAQKLEADYKVRQLDMFFADTIKAKSNILIKHGKNLNDSWGGFIDIIGCPQGISFSWSTVAVSTGSVLVIDTSNSIQYCEGQFDGLDFQVYFNADMTDTFFLEYQGSQVIFNSGETNATLFVWEEEIFIDGSASFPLIPDWIDDNLDSDNYMISSTWSTLDYPNWYWDNDADHRLSNFWYITPWADWYNIYWINDRVREYILSNTNNILPLQNINNLNEAYLYLDINTDYQIKILRFDRIAYKDFNELRILQTWQTESAQSAGIGYLQSNLTLAEDVTIVDGIIASRDRVWTEFIFDFENHDYALFVKNMNPNTTILYQMRVEDATYLPSYMMPIKDDENVIISMLGNHITFLENGIPIWENLEIIQLK